jgi:predicted glycosyltransferase
MRVMLYVQHLLGIGHLVRTSRIAQALHEAGHMVCVVSGGAPVQGFPPPGIELVQLPPVRSLDMSFSGLVDGEGRPLDSAFKRARLAAILKAARQFAPDCVVIEAYPFARRQMRFELVPLLEHLHAQGQRPLIASSVRDILQPKGADKDAATAATVNRFFDLVLVHGDERFSTLEETFTAASALGDKVVHTGLVAPVRMPVPPDEAFDVIVSAGGGAVGASLLDAAVAARPMTGLASLKWLIVTGPNLDDAAMMRLAGNAGGDVTLRRFEPALAQLFQRAKVSVSQAGYNTVADVLRAGCASVLVPFEGEGEREQLMRASRLEQAGHAVMLREGDLSPETLADAINRAAVLERRDIGLGLDGAQRSVSVLERRLAQFRRGQ